MTAARADVAPLSELRVHLGAHKTASTHLQMLLYDSRPALLAAGIDAIPHAELRRAGRGLIDPRLGPARRIGGAYRRACRDALAPLRQGPGRLVLSDENFLGASHFLLRRPPYWAAPFFLRPVRALAREAALAGGRTHLFIALRSFDAMLPAAYAQHLRTGPWHEPFDAVARRALARPPSWLPLLRLLRLTLPRAALTVWRHDDYRGNAHAILETVCGVPLPPVPSPADPFGTRTPGAEAVAWAAALPRGDDPEARRRLVWEKFKASTDAGDPRWAPFAAPQAERLRARLDADLKALSTWKGVRLLRF